MLITTLEQGETLLIGDNIRVAYVLQNSENQARIGIEAPKGVAILREELVRKEGKTL
jgi:carbon storage regulator CsrA